MLIIRKKTGGAGGVGPRFCLAVYYAIKLYIRRTRKTAKIESREKSNLGENLVDIRGVDRLENSMANEIALQVEIPTDPNSREYDSKVMSALGPRKRSFVIAMLQEGVNPKACTKAAAKCGYAPNTGYTLMRDEGILAALREEASKRLAGAALTAVNVLLDIAQDSTHKDQFRAAKELAGINGFTAEQRIVVEHISEDSKAQIRQIREMATQLGMDPQQLIRAAGIIDAEFEEVRERIAPAAVDDSDW